MHEDIIKACAAHGVMRSAAGAQHGLHVAQNVLNLAS